MTTRAPALRFAALGALLFAATRLVAPAPPPPAPVSRTATGSPLVDAALAAGVDRSPTARDRLVELGRRLGLADPGDRAGLEREARRLGLERSDPVLRRHLGDLLRLAAAAVPAGALPDDATLRAYYAEHAERWTHPARTRFTHVYLSRARRGAATAHDADALLATLRAAAMTPPRAATMGDPFARGSRIGPADHREVAAVFGGAFAARLDAVPTGQWSGPLTSAYGLHLVFVEDRLAATQPPFDIVRGQVLHQWRREAGERRQANALAALARR